MKKIPERSTKRGVKSEPLGVLAIWNGVNPRQEVEYHDWYIQQHMLERLRIPGFLAGCRYVAVGGGLKYFTWYLTSSVHILQTPAYRERIQHPTDWTRRIMPSFKNMSRSACRQTIDLGRGIGGATVALRMKASPGREGELRGWLSSSLFPDLLQSPGASGIIRMRLWEADPGVTYQKTSEQALRGGKDTIIDWAVVAEASTPAQAEKAGKNLKRCPFKAWGAESVEPPYVYQLMQYFPGPAGR